MSAVARGRKSILICADENSLKTSLSFLTERQEGSQGDWFTCCSGAREARRYLAQYAVDEIWVVSSDEVEAINLGAALKVDSPQATVFLAGCEKTGSVLSRVHAASLDGVLLLHELKERFAQYEKESEPKEEIVASPHSSTTSFVESESMGFLLSVVSGSGGAGKSTVSVLAALLAARRGLRVALLDADFQFGDLGDITGVGERIAADDLAANLHWLTEMDNASLVLVTAPRRLEQAEALVDNLDEVLNQLLACFDVVVANTGGGWDEQRLRLVERSTTALFLVDQRVSSVRACRHALDLCLRCGVATGPFLFAINRCHRHAAFTSIDVSSALQGAHVIELAEGGSEVEELMGAGMADGIVQAGNPLCQSIDALLNEVLPAARVPKGAAASHPAVRVDSVRASESTGRRRGRRRNRKQASTASVEPVGYPAQRSAR